MKLPSIITPIRAFAQANFSASFLFLDRMGEVAQRVRHYYESVQIGFDEIFLEGDTENSLLRVSDTRFWIAERAVKESLDLAAFMEMAVERFEVVADILEIENYSRTSLRVYYLEQMENVDEAVRVFRERHVNYGEQPFSVFPGSPTKCLITFAAKDESLTRELKVTAVRDEREVSSSDAGGILMDLEIISEDETPISDFNAMFEKELSASNKTITDFYRALKKTETPETKAIES